MTNQDGQAVNENPNQNPNQAQGNAQDNNQGQNPPPHNPFLPNAPLVPGVPPSQQLNWSHFKPEFAGKPKEEAEAHLLRTNHWMDMHDFPDNVKVQRFCLTLIGEARLWYKSLRPINVEWDSLQNMFRQQYSKIGNTREQLFHAWRSFHFDENAETIDAYVHHIRQVTNLLGYQDPQILEVFKNTLPSKLYWVLFPIDDLRNAVHTAKRMLTKEKIDKQLAGQFTSTPFMNIRDSQDKKVSFNIQDDLEHKIDRLMVMMDKLVTEDNGSSKPFKPQVYQPGRGRSQNRGNLCSRFRSNVYRGCASYNQNCRDGYRNNFNSRGSFGYNTRGSQKYRNNYNVYRRNNYRGQGYDRNRSRSLDRQDQSRRRDRSMSNGRSRSGSRASTNRDRIRCFECREYNHFAHLNEKRER